MLICWQRWYCLAITYPVIGPAHTLIHATDPRPVIQGSFALQHLRASTQCWPLRGQWQKSTAGPLHPIGSITSQKYWPSRGQRQHLTVGPPHLIGSVTSEQRWPSRVQRQHSTAGPPHAVGSVIPQQHSPL